MNQVLLSVSHVMEDITVSKLVYLSQRDCAQQDFFVSEMQTGLIPIKVLMQTDVQLATIALWEVFCQPNVLVERTTLTPTKRTFLTVWNAHLGITVARQA